MSMENTLEHNGLAILPRETVYTAASELFGTVLHRLEDGQPGRDFLKSIGIGKEEAKELSLGFAPDKIQGLSQAVRVCDCSGATMEMLDAYRLTRWRDRDLKGGKYYNFFRGCITRPVRFLPEFGGEIIGLIGVPLDRGNSKAVALMTGFSYEDRISSDFEEIWDWVFSKVRPECDETTTATPEKTSKP